jgi:3-oxoacyl-(acyl-carrier-protein) synthase III
VLSVRILGTASLLPGRRVPSAELVARAFPGRDPARVQSRIGIDTRHWTDPEDTVARIGAEVLRRALDAAGLEPAALARLILVTSSGGDCLVPATANGVARELGLDGTCDCFDLNNACTGFLTGLDLAARCVATGLGPVAVVAVEMLSRFIHPDHPRAWVVLGDAAGAAILGAGGPGEGVLASYFRNRGAWMDAVYGPHPGHPRLPDGRPAPPWIDFHRGYEEIAELALGQVRETADALLGAAGLDMDAVEWLVPHQPNGAILDAVLATLGVGPERSVRVVEEIGSVGAASVAVGLDRLFRSRDIRAGQRLMLVAMGGGISHGGLLWQVGR